MARNKFKKINNKVNFVELEHDILTKWDKNRVFQKLREKNKGNKPWSFLDGPITANNPMGVHHAWGRTLKDVYQRYNAMKGHDLRYQNGFDCQGLWVEVEVEKELEFKSKKEIIDFGIEKFVDLCKDRVAKFSKIQTEQSKRLGYWMDWENSYYTMSDENNYTIWSFLKKLYEKNKIYKGTDVVPWSGRSGTSYSQMEIIEGRKLVAHKSVFVKFPLINRENENLLVWTTTPWTLTSNISAAININLDYLKIKTNDGSIYYFAKENFKFQRLEKQFQDKKQWVEGIPKLKTIEQIFKERGGYKIIDTIKGKDMLGWAYKGPFDELEAQQFSGGYPFINKNLEKNNITAINCHKIIDGGKDSIGNDIVVAGEGTGIVHIATGCGAVDNKIGKKIGLVEIAPLDNEAKFIKGFDWLEGMSSTNPKTIDLILENLKEKDCLFYMEKYPHVYPHCWRSGDELVYRSVDEWYINMDWRDEIKNIVKDINWIPKWGYDREMEWLDNMGDWMISKKRFWGLALPIWQFEDDSFYVVGSKDELEMLAVEGWEEFKGKSPHRPWIDKVKIKHPETGLIGTRIEDVGNPWLDAGIVPFSTLNYNSNKDYWSKWFPADFVVECFPGQFRNWFYSLLAMSTIMESKAPFKTLLGHALVKDENGREMHKSWGNTIWFDEAAENIGVDTMRWMYATQNPEHNLLFGYNLADDVRKHLITLWNTYSFFITYAHLDDFNPKKYPLNKVKLIDLDKWILSKVNQFILIAEKRYKNFELFKLMKNATEILDDISNWYVRRNRRRFWKSENDEDKMAAYSTLYNVLLSYIKVLSPVIPFISDEMYENLVCSFDDNACSSIHLTDFPIYNESLVDENLILEIDSVKQIVSFGRSARNKSNLKIRQPLKKVKIYLKQKNDKVISNYNSQILQELNVKNVEYVPNENDIVHFELKPNFNNLGKKYGKEISKIVSEIKKMNVVEVIKSINLGNSIKVCDQFDLLEEDFEIVESAVENYSYAGDQNIKVAVCCTLNDTLIKEGVVRDVVRKVQNLRKESDFEVNDRISIVLKCSDHIFSAINENKDYFKNETLCKEIEKVEQVNFNPNSFNLDSEVVEIGIKKL